MHTARYNFAALLVLFLFMLTSCAGNGGSGHYNLTVAHINDTHSHLEPVPVRLKICGVETVAQLGGFARLQTLVDGVRNSSPNLLLLHAGDAVQGTLYFTLFNGRPEFDFLNRLGVDAMTFGNHEFDRGTAAIPAFLQRAGFPIVSSNIDFSDEQAIAPNVPAFIIKEINGERIGIIGLTTETTPLINMDVGKARFLGAAATATRHVGSLEALGVNKIVVLSHLGYQEDLKLAQSVNGIDVVIGGHSHTLLGEQADLAALGLVADGKYPTEVSTPEGGRALVAQAWQWGHMLGRLDLSFDSEGRILESRNGAIIPVGDEFMRNGITVPRDTPVYREIVEAINSTAAARIVAEDSAVVAELAPYAAQLETFRTNIVANAAEDLIRGINSGPGVLGADSMLAAVPKAQLAILNYGGVRKDLLAGNISVGDVLEVMPFANTLVVADLTGAELGNALEENLEFLLKKYGSISPPAAPYVAGVRYSVTMSAPQGNRVVALMVKDASGVYQPVDSNGIYRAVVNTFIAGGGDGFISIKNAGGFRSDTGIIDSDAFRDYLQMLGTVNSPAEQRISY